MKLKIGVLKEPGQEQRVALTPLGATKLLQNYNVELLVENEIGNGSWLKALDYVGAKVVNKIVIYRTVDLLLKINPPTEAEINEYRDGLTLVTQLHTKINSALLPLLAKKKINCFAIERIPQIPRAQNVDILALESMVIGYKAVLLAANLYQRFFPRITTMFGSNVPVKVLVLGVGSAGLRAIATAKRLGAQVFAYDIRLETKIKAEALGAEFIDAGVVAETDAGLARTLTEMERAQQQTVLAKYLDFCDVVIGLAGIKGGQRVPKIITKAMFAKLKPGSIVIDVLNKQGSNCELTTLGTQVINGVTLVGVDNFPSELANAASELYSESILNFVKLLLYHDTLNFNLKDEILNNTLVTYRGDIRI